MSWSLPVNFQLDDERSSIDQLLVAVSNHLSLRQWELARACLRKLVDDDPSAVREILRWLIYRADANAFRSVYVGTSANLNFERDGFVGGGTSLYVPKRVTKVPTIIV